MTRTNRIHYGTEQERCMRMTSPLAARAYIMEQARLESEGKLDAGNVVTRTKEFYSQAQYGSWLRKMSGKPGFQVVDTTTSDHPRMTIMTVTYTVAV